MRKQIYNGWEGDVEQMNKRREEHVCRAEMHVVRRKGKFSRQEIGE